MKLKKLRTEYSVATNSWWYLAVLNESLRQIRQFDTDEIQLRGKNIAIILNSATIVEGIVCESMSRPFSFNYQPTTINDRLMMDLGLRIDKSSWNDLCNIYKLVNGRDIQSDITPTTWKHTQSLFEFRNMIVHGKMLKISTYTKNGIRKTKVHGKYEKIYNFLAIETKVIPEAMLVDDKYPYVDLATSSSSDFYWNTARAFIKEYCSANPDITNDIFQRLNGLLKEKFE